MIDLLLGASDRLVKLLEIRQKARRDLFTDHVDPIFRDLRTITDDYRKIFAAVIDSLKDRNVSVHDTLKQIEKLRNEKLSLRRDIRRYSSILPRSFESDSVARFCTAALQLLLIAPRIDFRVYDEDSPLFSFFDEWKSLLDDTSIRVEAASDQTEEELRASLMVLTKEYARLIEAAWDQLSTVYFDMRASHLK